MSMGKTFKRAVQDLVIAAQEAAWSGSKPKEERGRYANDLVDARRLVVLKYEQLQDELKAQSQLRMDAANTIAELQAQLRKARRLM